MAREPHNRLLTVAAREVLRPLGLMQKGRSRTWLDDHGWWIGVVEFQPSSWAKGSYLNVGVTWPWHPGHEAFFFFDLSHRVAGFVEYESDEQFWPEACRMAQLAGTEITRIRDQLKTVDVAGRLLAARASRERSTSWPAWDAAVALGLSGENRSARKWFKKVARSSDDREWWVPVKAKAVAWRESVVEDPERFRTEVLELMKHNRVGLGLAPDRSSLPLL